MLKKLSEDAITLLRNNKSKLQKNDLKGVLSSINDGELRVEIVEYLIESGADPFKYLNKIPNNFMQDGTEVTSLTIPVNVESIGENAFRNSALKDVTLLGCELIDKRAFQSCSNLTNVSLGDVRIIKDNAFYATALKDIVLPETVAMLGKNVFPEDCMIRSTHRKKGSLKFPKSEYDWYKKHLVLDESLDKSVGDVE